MKNSLPRLRSVLEDASASLVLTVEPNDGVVQELLRGSNIEPIACVTLERLRQQEGTESPIKQPTSPLAYLQYTSGSTATPRGVMLSHRNVLAQCRGLMETAGIGPDSRSLCWLPYFHDYGLVHGIIGPFYAGIPAYLMSPITFLRRPLRWLEAIDRWSVTHSGAPNFAYDSCVLALRKKEGWTAGLERWSVASCGAEPIHSRTIDRFCEAFMQHGFRRKAFMPAYGLAESTLVVTSAPHDEEPLFLTVSVEQLENNRVEAVNELDQGVRTLVGCGRPLPEMRVKIVDPATLRQCRSDEVGEIWVSGPSVAEGYWNRPDMTKATFNAQAEDNRDHRYLRTGDLGFLHQGQAFITGRLKDLIILNGRNLYPNDLELALDGCHPSLRSGGCAAFSIDGPQGEQLVIVQEIDRVQDLDIDAAAAAIRVLLAEQFDVPVWAVVLVRSGSIPKTSSGKIQRRACRTAYMAQALPVVATRLAGSDRPLPSDGSWMVLKSSGNDIESIIIRLFAEYTGLSPATINPETLIVNFGLDSLKMTMIKNRIEEEFGVEVTFAQLFGQLTVRDLAVEIHASISSKPGIPVTRLDSSGESDGHLHDPAGPHILSPSQRRLWFLEQVQSGGAVNHISLAMSLKGPLDKELLKVSLKAITRRHEMLRAWFQSDGDRIDRYEASDVDLPIRQCTLDQGASLNEAEEIRRWVREEALLPFELARPPLLRVVLLERGADDHVLVLTAHRLIADGWSLRLLTRELTAIYNLNGRTDCLPDYPNGQYDVYAKWQESWNSSKSEAQLAYWKHRLSQLPSPVQLPTDRPRPRMRRLVGGSRGCRLPVETERSLERICREQGLTRFMVLYAAFTAWLQRCARTDDVVVGSVIANRRLPQWETTIGYFVNTVALRLKFGESTTTTDLLNRARHVVAGAYDHQDVPFERVIDALDSRPEGASAVPFNVMIVWEDDPLIELNLRGVSASHLPIEDVAAEFDLTLLVVNGAAGLDLVMLYDKALFDGVTVDRMLRQIQTLLAGMLRLPTARLAQIPMLGDEERRLVLVDWNRTSTEVCFSAAVTEVIENRTRSALDDMAVACGETRWSYGVLQRHAAVLARRILQKTNGENVRVGLCVERSVQSLAGLLGILKAGAAYVPLDPNAPEQRQRLILDDAGVSLLVTQRHLRSQLPFEGERIIVLEDIAEAGGKSAPAAIDFPSVDLDRLAYVIYTSGSTGRPKGVEVTHRALLSSLAARMHYYKEPVKSCLLTFPFAFDGSITGIFWALLHGGTVVIPSEDGFRDPRQLAGEIARHLVSHVVLVPSLYDVFLREIPPEWLSSLRVVVAAGESLPVDVVHRHYERLPHATLYNEYGPTEATVWTTVYRTNGTEQGARVPIGKPIANAYAYLLDSEMHPVPIGVVGEIYVGGAGLAKGYHNQPTLTGQKFIADPFHRGARLYRTGDLGLFRQDGNIEFVGREDDQVKIRGFRVELGEVEANLRNLPGIRDAAVVIQEDSGKGPVLVAFVTSDQTPISTSPHLQELLGRRVPSYMVPARVAVVDALPVLSNGKIDRNALRSRTFAAEPNGAFPGRPRDQIEQSLIELWSEVLGRRTSDVDQSFFALGGHSLLATQVVSRIRELFRVELPLRTLFDSPTISGVAEQIRLEQRRSTARPPLPPIVPVPRTMPLPLSFSQQRMWFVQQLAPEATAYNLLFVSRQRGALKIPILREVIDLLSRRHESFRTTFAMTGAGLVQRIARWQSPHLVEIDLRRLPKEQREQEARRLAQEEGARPFDLERGPLARISVVTLDQDDHLLLLNLHHIVGDQWSFGILGRDFAAYYNALSQDLPVPESPLPVQYADYAVWQRRCLTDETLKGQEDYWVRTLAELQVLYLPTDFPRPTTQTFRGAFCSVEFPQHLIEKLKEFSADHHVTSFMTMLACFHLLLSRYSGQTDVAVGSPIANRTQTTMEQLIGTFVNTLVLRLDVSGNPTFSQLVERVKEVALGAFANQDYPFDRLVDTLQVVRDPSMAPLIQVLFNMVNAPIGDIQLFGLKWEPFEVDPGTAQFDLSLTVELDVAKKAYLTFNTDLFRRETAERFLRHYVTLLQNALTDPAARLSQIAMLSKTERMRLLEDFNRTAAEYPSTQCFPELFEAQVQQTPDAIALSAEGRTITYRALNARANRTARFLRRMGVGPQTVVGLCLERSIELVTALLGILKAGGTYVPLDPHYPRDRVRFMVEDSGASLVVTMAGLEDRFIGLSCQIINVDQEEECLLRETDHDLPAAATAQDLAYILYTSGSTGQPKGVEIRHRSLVNFLWSMKREPGCFAQDVMLSVTTLSFDIAGLELYLPLLAGARVEIASRAVTMDGKRLVHCLERVQPTLMQATPATWRLLLEAGWSGSPSLTALCGGEGLAADLAARLRGRVKALWNMYGPTETTIWSTIDLVDPDHSEISIGRPIANTEIYVLDAEMQPVPIGVSGELFIGGDGLARGYCRRSDLTRDRFVRHPFSADPEARLYRTGDIARYREDGRLVHMGRLDNQVKIRGFRIELGEVESALSRHPKIRQVVVTAREDQYGLKQLAAYLVPEEGASPGAEELRSYVRALLPDYMVPSFFVALEKLPLTANKKVDVRALPAPATHGHSDGTKYVAPRSGMELQLAALWQQVLEVQDVGIHDNFFDLGGHSLKAAQLFFQLEVVFGKQLPLATLFQAPTIAELAAVLTRANWTPPWQSLIAIQPAGSATPLFMVPGVGGNILVFAKLAKLLGTEQPVYGLQARGLDGKETPFTSVPEMAAHYVEEIRRIHPDGPYLIAGICTGGLIAYEMAQQLIGKPGSVTLFMMDTWHPDSYARYKNRLFGRIFMTVIILGKIGADLGAIVRLPIREWWTSVARKSKVLFSLLFQSITEHIQDQDFQVQRLTQATFLAVARYRVRRFAGQIVNIVASRRRVDDLIPDTRHRWPQLASTESRTVHIPAEDSGRLFVSPHVEELTVHLQQCLHQSDGNRAATRPKTSGSHQA